MISVSACGLIYLALMNRYAVIVARVRGMMSSQENKKHKILKLNVLVRRAKVLQFSLVAVILAIIAFLSGILAAGLQETYQIVLGSLPIYFLSGIALLLLGMVLALIEVFFSLKTIDYDAEKFLN
jgi:hypothetical protein